MISIYKISFLGIVTPIGGTTRDAIDSNIRYYGKKITLVDTAGLRKKSKISDNIEFYSTIRTQNAILNCDLALVLIDAEKGFTKHDKSIIDDVILKGKGLIVIVNKWDLINKTTNTMKEFVDEMIYQFKMSRLKNPPIPKRTFLNDLINPITSCKCSTWASFLTKIKN